MKSKDFTKELHKVFVEDACVPLIDFGELKLLNPMTNSYSLIRMNVYGI